MFLFKKVTFGQCCFPKAILCIGHFFFLMSFGIEVIVIDFLSPFVRLMYMIELLILIFFCYFRKKKKEGTVEGDKSFVIIILLFKKCNRYTVMIIFWSLDGRISDLTLSLFYKTKF